MHDITYFSNFGGYFSGSSSFQRFKFGDKELDTMHGMTLYDFHARQHNPLTGRFMTMDPLAEKFYNTSPYAYCLNNPVKYVDPDGKHPIVIGGVVVGALDFLLISTGIVTTGLILHQMQNGDVGLGGSLFRPKSSSASQQKDEARASTKEGEREQKKRDEKSKEEDTSIQKKHDEMLQNNVPDGSGDPKGGDPKGGAIGVITVGTAAGVRIGMELRNPDPSKDAYDAHIEKEKKKEGEPEQEQDLK